MSFLAARRPAHIHDTGAERETAAAHGPPSRHSRLVDQKRALDE
jgi:hypothetical protein